MSEESAGRSRARSDDPPGFVLPVVVKWGIVVVVNDFVRVVVGLARGRCHDFSRGSCQTAACSAWELS
jgi:hypothetical protein